MAHFVLDAQSVSDPNAGCKSATYQAHHQYAGQTICAVEHRFRNTLYQQSARVPKLLLDFPEKYKISSLKPPPWLILTPGTSLVKAKLVEHLQFAAP